MVFCPLKSELVIEKYKMFKDVDELLYYNDIRIDNIDIKNWKIYDIIKNENNKIIILSSADDYVKLILKNNMICDMDIFVNGEYETYTLDIPLTDKQKYELICEVKKYEEQLKYSELNKDIDNDLLTICAKVNVNDFNDIFDKFISYIIKRLKYHKKISKITNNHWYIDINSLKKCLQKNEYEKYEKFKKYIDMIFFS